VQSIRALSYMAALLGCGINAACSQTADIESVMDVRGYALPPPGFNMFCAEYVDLCSTAGTVSVMELTPGRRAELISVNSMVNSHIAERSDISTTGWGDVWTLPSTQGDCEDFAIMKKAKLIERGWPASVLLLTVGRLKDRGHTVLTVRTSDGDLILDNRTSEIRNWSQTSLRYYARQSQSDGIEWKRIRPSAQ
jgi:predicted transglutaminase-like cysteine proteinase